MGAQLQHQFPGIDQTISIPALRWHVTSHRIKFCAFHYVSHRPADLLQANLQCLLVQTTLDQPISPFLRLVLVDIEFYGSGELKPFAFRRLAKWLPHTINRRSIFRMLDLEDHYDDHFDRCHLWHNHRVIDSAQIIPLRLMDGDYIKLYIGDSPDSSSCPSASSLSDEAPTNESWHPDEEQVPEDELSSASQILTEPQTSMLRVHASDVRAPHLVSSDDPARRPANPGGQVSFHSEDLQRFRRLFASHSITECEDEGPIAYVDSWPIHHQQHRDCAEIKTGQDSPCFTQLD